ncbi:T9SS type A sorting domain-containing protein [bacterium]|nr:T9SS type A sorting domain-containing protein [bacterium]
MRSEKLVLAISILLCLFTIASGQVTEFKEDFKNLSHCDLSKTTAQWHSSGTIPPYIDSNNDSSYGAPGSKIFEELQYKGCRTCCPMKLAIDGNWIYAVTNNNQGFRSFEIGNDGSGAGRDSIGTFNARDLAVSSGYAYVTRVRLSGTHDTMIVVDLDYPDNLTRRGKIGISGDCYGIAVSGEYAFVCANDSVVSINISNPANPIPGDAVSTGISNARDIVIFGRYAFVADNEQGLVVLNISDPTSMDRVYTLATVHNPNALAVSGLYVYVATDDSFLVVDVSTPTLPVRVAGVQLGDKGNDVAIYGKSALVADARRGVSYFDISVPTSPVWINTGQLNSSGVCAMGVAANGNKLAIADSANIQILNGGDVTTETATTWTASTGSIGEIIDIVLVGNYAYGVSQTTGIIILDISANDTIKAIDTLVVPGASLVGIRASGNMLYVAGGHAGLLAYSLAEPASPSLAWNAAGVNIGSVYEVVPCGAYVFAAIGDVIDTCSYGVRRLAASNGAKRGYFRTTESITDIDAGGNFIFAAADEAGVISFDINLTVLDTYVTSYQVWGIDVEGNYAYIAEVEGGFGILDIKFPDNMSYIGGDASLIRAFGVTASSGYAYVATTNGLYIVDVEDPYDIPTPTATNTGVALPEVALLNGDHLFVADYLGGVRSWKVYNNPLGELKTLSVLYSSEITGPTNTFNFLHWATTPDPEHHDETALTDTIWYWLVYQNESDEKESLLIVENEEDPPPGPPGPFGPPGGGMSFHWIGSTAFDSLWWYGIIHEQNVTPTNPGDSIWFVDTVKVAYKYQPLMRAMGSWHFGIEAQITEAFFDVGFGTDTNASDGFDGGLDEIYIPTGIGNEFYFLFDDPDHPEITGLSQYITNPFDKPHTLKIVTRGAPGTAYWNPANVPGPEFFINGINMLEAATLDFEENDTLIIEYESYSNIFFPHRLKRGWNMISLIGFNRINSLSDIFSDAIGSAYHYDPLSYGYASIVDLEPGQGYFVFVPNTWTYSYRGVPIVRYTIDLEPGWNMIGGLSEDPVNWFDLSTEPPDALTPGSMYYFNPATGAYVSTLSLEPGNGGWIHASTSCQLTVNPEMALSKSINKSHLIKCSPKWMGRIHVNKEEIDNTLTFGYHPEASTNYDPEFDMIAPPPAPNRSWNCYLQNSEPVNEYYTDIKPEQSPQWHLSLEGSGEFNIQFDLNELPPTYDLYIALDENITLLENQTEITLKEGCYKFWLTGNNSLPLTFDLRQNYPNPFNLTTQINFSIPRSGKTTLEIFNILGEEVVQLIDETLNPGYYNLKWNGKNGKDKTVATGLYFAKLKWKDETKITRMILLK